MSRTETLNSLEIKVAETNTVFLGLPLVYLMENAGRSVADAVEERLGGVEGRKITVFAGKGGNAGDGLVAARHLASRGARVEVLLFYPPETVNHPDTRFNLDYISRLDTVKLVRIRDPCSVKPVESDAYIDALLGIGFKGNVRNPVKAAVEAFNKGDPELKIAVDVPTGVDSDTGQASDPSVRADVTVTMQYMKPGLLKAGEYTGEVIVAPIGIPLEARLYVGPGDVKHRVPEKPQDAHKGVGGRVSIIGGSELYTGAPALSAMAALRTGSDLAFVYTGEKASRIVAGFDPDLIVRSCPGDHLDPQCVEAFIEEWSRSTAVVLGPGLGRHGDTVDAVLELVEKLGESGVPLVVDADALKALAGSGVRLPGNTVLTPHRGEASLMLGHRIGNTLDEWVKAALSLAEKTGAVVLLKAPVDVIASPQGVYRLNRVHHKAMSVGGTGDVLTGITAALLSRGLDAYNAAAVAAYINGRAGEMAVSLYGERITARDLLGFIPEVFKEAYTKY